MDRTIKTGDPALMLRYMLDANLVNAAMEALGVDSLSQLLGWAHAEATKTQESRAQVGQGEAEKA